MCCPRVPVCGVCSSTDGRRNERRRRVLIGLFLRAWSRARSWGHCPRSRLPTRGVRVPPRRATGCGSNRPAPGSRPPGSGSGSIGGRAARAPGSRCADGIGVRRAGAGGGGGAVPARLLRPAASAPDARGADGVARRAARHRRIDRGRAVRSRRPSIRSPRPGHPRCGRRSSGFPSWRVCSAPGPALELVKEELADPTSDRVIEVLLLAHERGGPIVRHIWRISSTRRPATSSCSTRWRPKGSRCGSTRGRSSCCRGWCWSR